MGSTGPRGWTPTWQGWDKGRPTAAERICLKPLRVSYCRSQGAGWGWQDWVEPKHHHWGLITVLTDPSPEGQQESEINLPNGGGILSPALSKATPPTLVMGSLGIPERQPLKTAKVCQSSGYEMLFHCGLNLHFLHC